jgi:hypothetical protein
MAGPPARRPPPRASLRDGLRLAASQVKGRRRISVIHEAASA